MANGTRTLALLALSALLAACSGGGNGSPGTGTPSAAVSREDYAQRLAEWLCDDLAACCSDSVETVDRAACVAVKREAELHRLASEESHGVRAFDGAVAGECIAALDETPASCGYERRVQRCFQTYDGVAALGESCSGKVSCRGMASGDVACVQGRCTKRLPAGQACEDLGDDPGACDVCRGDARCRESTDGGHACFAYERRRGVAGDRCTRPDTTQPLEPGTVIAVADCEAADGLRCSADGVCAPHAALGEACRAFDCVAGARCEGGVCVPGLAAGATCTSGRDCGAALYCRWTDFVCDQRDPETGICLSETLISGTCSAPSGAGETCNAHVRCADTLYCSSSRPDVDGQCLARPNACEAGLEKLARQAAKRG